MTEEVVEERLKNDEFRELIPYLQMEDLFLIQIKYLEWQRMFECVSENKIEQIRCNLCVDKPLLKLKDFEDHIKEENHKNALKSVEEFYHPIYTYAKDKENSGEQESDSVSNTNKSSDEEAQTYEAKRLATLVNTLSKQKVVRLSMDDIMKIICFSEPKKFPLLSHGRKDLLRCVLCNKIVKNLDMHFKEEDHVNRMLDLKSITLENHPEVNKYTIIQTDMNSEDVLAYERILKELVMKEKPKAPHMMEIACEMELSDLFLIEYIKRRKFQPMLIKVKKYHVKCALCQKTCSIPDLSSHLLGKQHKKTQLGLNGLRHQINKEVTKYWSFTVGKSYNFQVTLKARKKYRPQVILELNRLKKLDSNGIKDSKDTKDVSEGCEMTSKEVCENENEEAQNEELTNETTEEIVDIPDETEAVQLPQLSEKVAAKVKALQAANSNKNKANVDNPDDDKKRKGSERNPIPNVSPEGALIGVEYVVKILSNNRTQLYECCLCEVLMNERHMQSHLTGYNHRYKYCELHYSDALKKYLGCLSDLNCKDVAQVMGPILAKVAYEIEKYHGRGVPRVVSAEEFKNKRPDVIAKLYCSKHATQQYGPSYTNVVSQEEIKSLIENKETFSRDTKIPPKNCTNRFIVYTNGLTYCSQKIRAENIGSNIAEARTHRDRNLEKRRRSRSFSPNRNKRSSAQKVPERTFLLERERPSPGFNEHNQSIWQKYRQQILVSASEVEYAYIEYRKNPESHPLYDQEWNRFWKQRKDELIAEGIDHRSYNFQPEWVPFFRNRIEQLFGEALQQAKLDVRRRLNIPMDAEEDCESGVNLRDNDFSRNFNLRNEAQRSHFANDPTMQERQTSLVRYSSPHLVPKKQRFDTESLVNQWNAQKSTRDGRRDEMIPSDRRSVQNYAESKPDVIHVLRLMAAFEDYLGSLGSKITDLLFMTLSLDKTFSKDTLLLEQKVLNANNCSLLETAMEKLRGILYAGLLDNSKEAGFNQVIQCTESLLDYADKMRYRQQFSVPQENSESLQSRNIQPTAETNFQELFNFINNQKSMDDNSTQGKKFPPDLRSITYSSFGDQNNLQDTNTNSTFNPRQQNFTNTSQQFNQDQRQGRNLANRNNSNTNPTNTALNRETQNRFNSDERFSGGNFGISDMVGRHNRQTYQGSGQSSDNINMASVVGRNNHGNSNLNNNYPKNNYPNTINNNAMFQSSGFSGNWNRNPGNSSQQPNPAKRDWKQANTTAGNMSALQLQNLKQMQFLRQQQQQRLNQQK